MRRIRTTTHGCVLAALMVAVSAAACGHSGPADSAKNPLAGRQFYVPADPAPAAAAADDPQQAPLYDKIARTPQAVWVNGGTPAEARERVRRVVTRAGAAHRLPVLVAYNIPQRDCGGPSSGGAPSPDAYRSWVQAFADAIGRTSAVVIVEPDALAQLDCLPRPDQSTRLALLRYAVTTLGGHSATVVYLDAGHAGWVPATTMAQRLSQAGVHDARGFALNVSNFDWTSSELAYGNALSRATGGTHFVIDTSRNGRGPAPDNAWCNPPDRALGARPTTTTGDRSADAFLWIKNPGFSDGSCGPGEPAAGQWWAAYALGLAQRASW